MKIEQYQELTSQFAVYPSDVAMEYLALGLFSEVGEVASLVKKKVRGDYIPLFNERLKAELGDVAWYLAELANKAESPLYIEDCPSNKCLADIDGATFAPMAFSFLSELVDEIANLLNEVEWGDAIEETLADVVEVFCRFVNHLGFSLEEILDRNIEKLSDRKDRGVIKGSGDER